MTLNRKIHARIPRLRTLIYALLTGFSSANGALSEPIGTSGLLHPQPALIMIGEDGIAHPSNEQSMLVATVNAADSQSVERPDLQFANVVNPLRFGDAAAIQNPQTGAYPDPSTKHYSAAEISSLIDTESAKIGIDPAYVRLIADIESQFNQFALSQTGAIGVMQLMPDTATQFGVTNPHDAAQNIRGGVSYLKQLLDEFHNPLMAAAAYHSGPQAARNANGIPDGPRTAKYMVRILNDYYRISESNFAPSTSASLVPSVSYETTASVTPLRETPKHKANRVSAPPQSVVGSQPDTPHWEAGFVMNLD